MYKAINILKLFVFISFVLVSTHVGANNKIAPTLWQIEKNNVTSYLFGTVHLGDADMNGLPTAVTNAIKKSQRVVVEVDLSKLSPMEIQQKSMQYMTLPAGKSLKTELSQENYNKLKTYLGKKGIDILLMDRIQPWGVMLTVTLMEYQNAGFSEQNGIDKQVLKLANEKQITVQSLETLDQQLTLFNQLSQYNDKLVSDSLEELAQMDSHFNKLINSWKRGDHNALEKYYRDTFTQDSYSAKTEQVLLVNRNQNWITQLKTPLTQTPHFIAVGALHLVAENGLVTLLRNEGFKVTKL